MAPIRVRLLEQEAFHEPRTASRPGSQRADRRTRLGTFAPVGRFEKGAGGVTLDVCYGGCGGLWFDASEPERVSARAAATLHTIWNVPVSSVKLTEPRLCPRCLEQVLERKWFSDMKKVEID